MWEIELFSYAVVEKQSGGTVTTSITALSESRTVSESLFTGVLGRAFLEFGLTKRPHDWLAVDNTAFQSKVHNLFSGCDKTCIKFIKFDLKPRSFERRVLNFSSKYQQPKFRCCGVSAIAFERLCVLEASNL